MRGGVLSRH